MACSRCTTALPRRTLADCGSNRMNATPERILIVRLNDVGEAVIATAAVSAARAAWPGAFIGVLTSPPSDDLLRCDPHLDRFFVCRKSKWRQGRRAEFLRELATLLGEIRQCRFDAVVDLQNNPTTHWLIRATGIPRRVGLRTTHFSSRLHTHLVTPCDEWETTHQVDHFRQILSELGDVPPADPILRVDDEAQRCVDERLERLGQSSGHRVLLQPGAGLLGRMWPVDRYAELARWLAVERGATVMVHAGPGEEPLAETIVAREPSVIVQAGLTLQELAALLLRVDVFVTNDSGPMHIAAALGTKQVAIFGASDPRVSGPYTGPGRIVTHDRHFPFSERDEYDCSPQGTLEDVRLDTVRSVVAELL